MSSKFPLLPPRAAAAEVLALGLQIVVYYAIVRFVIYSVLPTPITADHQFVFDSFLSRDIVMGVPRLAAFAACLAIAKRYGGFRLWGWHGGASVGGVALSILAGLLVVSKWGFGFWGTPAYELPGQIKGWLSTGPVGLMEEALFRGLLLPALAVFIGWRKSALFNAVLFALYHVQAQKLDTAPLLLAFGWLTCAAYAKGVGLPWLIAVHWIADALWFHAAFIDLDISWLFGQSFAVFFWAGALFGSRTAWKTLGDVDAALAQKRAKPLHRHA